MNGQNTYSKSHMTPALSIIKLLIVLTIIGAVISGGLSILGFLVTLGRPGPIDGGLVICISIFFNLLVSILLLLILKCFALCFDSMERTLRRIEHKIRKDEPKSKSTDNNISLNL